MRAITFSYHDDHDNKTVLMKKISIFNKLPRWSRPLDWVFVLWSYYDDDYDVALVW